MTLNQFQLLSEEDQATTTWANGSFLAIGDMEHIKVLLYQIHGFYVEAFYNCESNKVEYFKSFSSTDDLEPYLQAIDLSDIIGIINPTYKS